MFVIKTEENVDFKNCLSSVGKLCMCKAAPVLVLLKLPSQQGNEWGEARAARAEVEPA